VQALFTVVEQAVDAYLPAVHTVQAVQLAAFVVVLYVDPATQDVQALLTVVEHAVETRVPAGQVLHAVQTRFVDTVQAVD